MTEKQQTLGELFAQKDLEAAIGRCLGYASSDQPDPARVAALAAKLGACTFIDMLGWPDPAAREREGEVAASLESKPVTAVVASINALDTMEFWGLFTREGEMVLTTSGWEYLLAELAAPCSQLVEGFAALLLTEGRASEPSLVVFLSGGLAALEQS